MSRSIGLSTTRLPKIARAVPETPQRRGVSTDTPINGEDAIFKETCIVNISCSTAPRLRRPLLGALVALLALTISPQPASARMGSLVFINKSKLCAYVTIYHKPDGEHSTWHAAGGTLQPRYVKAGANFACQCPALLNLLFLDISKPSRYVAHVGLN